MYARLLLFVLFFVSWTFTSSAFQIGYPSGTGYPSGIGSSSSTGSSATSGNYFPSTTTNNNGLCGRCGEKAIQGKCCKGKIHDDGICWCKCNTGVDCAKDEYCRGSWCVNERPDQTCGACGKPPINNVCCGKGIVDNVQNTGLCICDIDTGCTNNNKCDANYVCCKDGKCDSMKLDLPCSGHGGEY